MATVGTAEYDQASPEVKAVYNDIMATRNIDRVPDFWRIVANHPPTLARLWEELKAVMAPGRLDPLTKEMIAIAVSATNSCAYCVNSHTAAAMKLGMDREMLGELMAVVGLFNKTNKLADGYQIAPDVIPPKE